VDKFDQIVWFHKTIADPALETSCDFKTFKLIDEEIYTRINISLSILLLRFSDESF
jgi:hypothetical protein